MGITILDNHSARSDRPLEGETSVQHENYGPAELDLAPSQEAYYKKLTQLCYKGDQTACGVLRKMDGIDKNNRDRSDF